MSQKAIKKVGFFTALALMTSSIIGIGIFFKNGSIQNAVNQEGISWLIVWILAGVISLGAALSFGEIGSMKTGRLIGIANFANRTSGRKIGYLVYTAYIYFYLPILLAIISFFVSESIFTVINQSVTTPIEFPIYSIVIASAVVMIGSVFIIHLSKTVSGWIAKITIVLKLIPLLAAIVVGIIFPNIINTESGEVATRTIAGKTESINAFANAPSTASIQGIVVGLPGALFSYDSFLNVASVGKRLNNPKRSLPLVIIAGLSLVITVYTLIGLSGALHNQGSVSGVLQDSLGSKVSEDVIKGITIAVWVFISVSAYGVLNSMCYVLLFEMENGIKYRLIPFATKAKKTFKSFAPFFYVFFVGMFYFTLISVLVILTDSDALADGLSNIPTVIFYGFYGLIILMYAFRRKKMETSKINSFAFWLFSIIALLGISLFVVSYPVFVIMNVLDDKNVSWGAFFSNGVTFHSLVELIVFFAGIGWIIFLAVMAALVARITEKHNPVAESNKPLEEEKEEELKHVTQRHEKIKLNF